MRPVTLKFAGLRSYRGEQEIDFTDVSLMAIVGDTGAGKSSILEGLCFALYGVCTWNGNSGKDLITDGGDGTLRVELVFRARGKTWRVTRTTSAGSSPPAKNRLEGLSDSSDVVGFQAVNDAVQQLVGLGHKAFLRAVVLPQGKFQELLQAKATERTSILKSVLGLDELAEVRRQAAAEFHRLAPQLLELERRRAPLPADPAAAIADADERLSAAAAQVEQLSDLTSVITLARKDADDHAQLAGKYRTAAKRLADDLPADLADHYASLIKLDTELAGEITVAERELEETEGEETRLQTFLAEADLAGTGVSGVASTLTGLEALRGQLAEVSVQETELAEEKTALDSARAELRERRIGHADLVTKAGTIAAEARLAETAHSDAGTKLSQCRDLLTEARRATTSASNATAALPQLRQALRERTSDVTDAEQAVKDAKKRLGRATKDLDTLHRKNSAAHAAGESHPGDPCPICVRPLPVDFAPPTTAGTEQAKTERTQAEQETEAVGAELVEAQNSRTAAQVRLEEAIKLTDELCEERDSACSAAFEALGAVDFALDDETILQEVEEQVRRAAEARETIAVDAKAAQDAMKDNDAYLRHTDPAVTQREKALEKNLSALDRRKEKVATLYSAVPEPYRSAPEPTDAAIDLGVEKAKQRKEELDRITTRLGTVQKQAKLLRDKKKGLAERRDSEVGQPATQLNLLVQTIATRSAAAAELTEMPAPGDRPAPPSILGDAQWARDVLAAATKIVEGCRSAAAAQDGQVLAAQSRVAEALATAGLPDEAQLEGRLTNARTDAREATRDRETAIGLQPLCAELDSRIATAKPVVESLHELDGLLADGKFPAMVVKRRQRALLEHASRLLRSMTRDRFAFSADFRIVDGHTAQPRDVRTLSGGETFLASLALALGLVELTSRGGGRVEALFLDEGFGSLDSTVLGDALDALARQADDGRLVAVISHMRDVAENFDDVLLVTRTPGGSQARWLDPAERDQLVTDELAAGLLS